MTTLTVSELTNGFIEIGIKSKKYAVSIESLKHVPLLETLVNYQLAESKNNMIDIQMIPINVIKKIIKCLSDSDDLSRVLLSLTSLSYELTDIIYYCNYLNISNEFITTLIKPRTIKEYNYIIYDFSNNSIKEPVYNDNLDNHDNHVDFEICMGYELSSLKKIIPIMIKVVDFVFRSDTDSKHIGAIVDVTKYIRHKINMDENGKKTEVDYFQGYDIKTNNNIDIIIPHNEIIIYGVLMFLRMDSIINPLTNNNINYSETFLKWVVYIYRLM